MDGGNVDMITVDASFDVGFDGHPVDASFDSAGFDGPPLDGSFDGIEGCDYMGKRYGIQQTFASSDGCTICTCTLTGIVCAQLACSDGGAPDATTGGVCTPGKDATCNEDPTVSSLRGTCQADGTCACGANIRSSYTGRCLNPGDTNDNACEYAGVSRAIGTQFPCVDGCNTCMCTAAGKLASTTAGCTCSWGDVYIFGEVGGLRAYDDQVTLSPPAGYLHARTSPSTNATMACAPALPACHTDVGIDVSRIMTDIQNPTLQQQLAANPGRQVLFGVDGRAYDGAVFSFKTGSGSGFLMGDPCTSTSTSCTPPPDFVTRLVTDLRALDAQQLRDPSCAILK